MSLDGWSLDKKINELRDNLTKEMKELKVHFAVLYDYMKSMEEAKKVQKKTKKSSVIKN